MTLADFPQARTLSALEKLQLADELWIEATRQAEILEITSDERRLLDERWERFLHNPDSALTLEEFQGRIRVQRA